MELKLINTEQVAFYLSKGVEPLRVELGKNNRIVFIYSKDETKELFGQWLKISEIKRKEKAEYRKNFT